MTCSYGRSGHIHCRIFSETCVKGRVSSKNDFHTYSTKIATPTRMGPGVQGPNGGPELSLMCILIRVAAALWRWIGSLEYIFCPFGFLSGAIVSLGVDFGVHLAPLGVRLGRFGAPGAA